MFLPEMTHEGTQLLQIKGKYIQNPLIHITENA